MNWDLLNERNLSSLLNIIIDVEYVADPSHISEISVVAEFVWENTLEKVVLCD